MSRLEIVFDPVAEAVENGLLLDDRHEVLADGDWIRAARRWTGRRDLFVYRHAETGNFVLAGWLYDPKVHGIAVAVELETMELPPDRGGWLSREYMEARMRPFDEHARAIARRIRRRRAVERDARIESQQQRKDAERWMTARGMEPFKPCTPYVGESEGGEELQRITEELQRMVKSA